MTTRPPVTFSRAVDLFFTHLQAKRRSPHTVDWYTEQLAAFRKWAKLRGIGDALPDVNMIDEYMADQHATGLKPSTVNARFRALRAVLLFLERRRYLAHDDNPIRMTEAPNVPREVRRYVSPEACAALLASIDGRTWLDWRDRLIVMLLFYSGVRVSELTGLRVGDLDTQNLAMTVRHAKGDRQRVVPLHPDVGRPYTAYLYSRPAHADELLLASDGYDGTSGLLTREGVRQMLIRRCRAAGMPYYSPHAFRHGFAMWLLNSGARLSTVSTAMGHSDTQITQKVYAHTTLVTVRGEYDAALERIRKAGAL